MVSGSMVNRLYQGLAFYRNLFTLWRHNEKKPLLSSAASGRYLPGLICGRIRYLIHSNSPGRINAEVPQFINLAHQVAIAGLELPTRLLKGFGKRINGAFTFSMPSSSVTHFLYRGSAREMTLCTLRDWRFCQRCSSA